MDQGLVGRVPFGRKPRVSNLNIQYGPPSWNNFALELQAQNTGQGYADQANQLKLPSITTVDLGLRYRFDLFDSPATLRFRAQNITNTYATLKKLPNAIRLATKHVFALIFVMAIFCIINWCKNYSSWIL